MTTPNHLSQRRQPKGVPGAGEFAGINRPDSEAAPLTLAPKPSMPSPASVAQFAARQRLATAPKQEPSYKVELGAIPVREVNLGRGIDLDLFAGRYPEYDVFSFDEDGEVVDFNPATGTDAQLREWTQVISSGFHVN